MLKTLKFVQGAVAKKDFMPAMTHFRIENGTVRGFNGTLAICAPIDIGFNCIPHAEKLIKAIARCDTDDMKMSITPAGRLSIKSGSFKALVDCVPEQETPHLMPQGKVYEIDGALLIEAIKAVEPFISDDAARKWSTGVLLKGQSALATNNVCIVEYWTGINFSHPLNIPESCVRELLRIGEAPTSIQMGEGNITFHYTEGRWIRTQLLDTNWPDLTKLLGKPSNPKLVPETLFKELEKLKDFVDKFGNVYFREDKLSTTYHEDAESGAVVSVPGIPDGALFNFEMLMLLRGVAATIDFNAYPAPCAFFGNRLRGAIVGRRNKFTEPDNAKS